MVWCAEAVTGENPAPKYGLTVRPAKRGEAGRDGPPASITMAWDEDGKTCTKSVTIPEWVEP